MDAERRRDEVAVIGPSHLHADYLSEGDRRRFYADRGIVEIEAHRGLPAWSSRVPAMLREQAALGRRVAWVVTDWKANNRDYETFKRFGDGGVDDGPVFLDQLGHPGNMLREFMSPEHMEFLARRAMRAIDEVVRQVPEVRLVFWCLYKRTRAAAHESSYPQFARYEETVARYRDNAVDIDAFTTPEAFDGPLTTDGGGHPSSAGHDLLSNLITFSHRDGVPRQQAA